LWRPGGPTAAAVAAVAALKAVEDNLSAKAAGNKSVDGRMTAWMTKSDGGQQRNNQPSNGGAASATLAAA
jgi:hypothetical protein